MAAVAQKLKEHSVVVIDKNRKEMVFEDEKTQTQVHISSTSTSITIADDELDSSIQASATYNTVNTNKFPAIGGACLPQPQGEGDYGTEDKNWLLDHHSSSSSQVKNPQDKEEEPIGVAILTSEVVKEIYLKKIYYLPPNHEFYCPSCKVCIDKVLLCKTGEDPSPPVPPLMRCSACFAFLVQKGTEWFSGCLPPPDTSNVGWEVVKSFVYGGLAELLASLSVVTSSASADANTLNIVALAIANLIGGLVLLILNGPKNTQPREEENETETEAPVDKYYESLGKREHFYLHIFVAVLSFLIFGLLPPVVYGFSFRESDDKDLKLAAVAGASLIGITLLALAKAHTQRRPNSNSYVIYFTTVLYYVTSGVLASLLTYVAGAALKRLVEQLGWFEPQPTINGGIANAMSFPTAKNQGFGYY